MKNRIGPVVAVLAVLAAIGFVQAEFQTLDRFAPSERVVMVTNFPNPQNVVGTVDVGNLPAVQEVSGVVEVSNLGNTGPTEWVFVGVTASTFQGNGTRVAMNQACAAEYAGSRMAFTDEYTETTNPPTTGGMAWIQPRVAVAFATANDVNYGFDRAGNAFLVRNFQGANCNSWTSGSSGDFGGALFLATGALKMWNCSETMAVACCAPV